MVDGDLVEGAVALRGRTSPIGGRLPRLRDLPVVHPNAEGFLAVARGRGGRGLEGLSGAAQVRRRRSPPRRPSRSRRDCARSVTFSLALLSTPESAALRHAFFAERAAAKIADVPEDTARRDRSEARP